MASPLIEERQQRLEWVDLPPAPHPARRLADMVRRAWLTSPRWRTAAALGWLAVCTLVLFCRSILFGLIYYESDTVNYYMPVRQVFDAALARGDLPLWTPYIYGGFPLFADGEGGMLYPLNVLFSAFLALTPAHTAQLLVRFWLAGAFAFWFARTLGLSRLAGLVAGLVFTFSSFTVGQLHHTNVGNSAIWLPAVLGCFERARRSGRRGTIGWTLAGGVALANSLLGVHVQPVLMTLLALALWCVFRTGPELWLALRPAWRAAALRRAAATLAIAPAMVAIGLALAAAQLLPLYELSRFSARGEGVSYTFASTYGPNPSNLIGLIFPAFFQGVGGQWWSLWSKWESTIYVGVAPLALALIAAAFRRSRETWFFAALAVASLLVALGDYSPIKLFWFVWHLPGFSVTRAPGRFSFLFTFAIAMLAASGMHWLATHVHAEAPRRRPRPNWWPMPADPFVRLRLLGLGAVAATAAIVTAVLAAREWLILDRSAALALIRGVYLNLQRDPRFKITPETILSSLEQVLSLNNSRTALAVALLAGLALCFVGWGWLRRHPNLWHALLVGLISVDLLIFAFDFHPVMAVTELEQTSGVAGFLTEHPGLYRHYHRGSPPNSSEPNRLMPWGRFDAGGYSSLEFERVNDYLSRLQYLDGAMLDLMNIRYLISKREALPLPDYGGVQYDAGRPLSAGVSANPNSRLALSAGGVRAAELRLILYLRNARSVPQGAPVGEVRAIAADGSVLHFPLRAGVEVADESVELAGPGPLAHRAVPAAFYRPIVDSAGHPLSGRLTGGYAAFALNGVAVDQIEVDFTGTTGQLQVVGAGLVDPAGAVTQLTHRAKYRTVYEDATGWVDENSAVMPRAFLVTDTVDAPGGRATLDYMVEGPFDPRRQAVIEGNLPRPLTDPSPAAGTATVEQYEDRRVVVSASTPADAMLVLSDVVYPGWRVYVDGQEAPLLIADYIFRGVFLPAGEHHVEFVYDPLSFKVGVAISGASLLAVLLGLGWLWLRRRYSTTIGSVVQ